MTPTARLAALLLLAAPGVAPSLAAEPDLTRTLVATSADAIIAQGAGPSVVLSPSRGRGAAVFDRLATAGHRVIRLEPRGIGRSSGPSDALSLHDLGREVAAAVEGPGAAPAFIVGHGGMVARGD